MGSKEQDPVDVRDALDILESESKEAEKDAEIDRILKAFRLDAYGPCYHFPVM
jgi:DnaJ homolog subfamily C member 8